jgi:hypothetical protein
MQVENNILNEVIVVKPFFTKEVCCLLQLRLIKIAKKMQWNFSGVSSSGLFCKN